MLSCVTGAPRRLAGIPAVNDDRLRACDNALIPGVREYDCGEAEPCGIELDCGTEVPWRGDPLSVPALNGLNDKDGRLAMATLSSAMDEGLCDVPGLRPGSESTGGELVWEPIFRAARKAEMGLAPRGGASPWNVDKLPYVCMPLVSLERR